MRKQDFSTTNHWISRLRQFWRQYQLRQKPGEIRPRFLKAEREFPAFVRNCPVTASLIRWLRLLKWDCIPVSQYCYFGQEPVPLAAYIGAFLVKLDRQLPTIAHLHRFLLEHPALIWALGFPLAQGETVYGFDPQASLPCHRHFSWVLRELPNEVLQQLLSSQVNWMAERLPQSFGQTISLDTKHILAWVKENNPKAYIKEGRFDKTRQPAGDPDCKLGCKRKHNRQVKDTPTTEGQAVSVKPVKVGEYYWGYASGIVVTKVEGWGEFVLAEMTQTFDKGDTTFFFPLMQLVKARLGFQPRYGAFDAAFDAFYIHDYFHSPDHDGFAAVPFSEKGGKPDRKFDENGLPLCDAALAMPLKFTYHDRTTAIIPYERAKHVCPLLYPQPNGQTCPINHKNWPDGGCATHIAHTIGSRIRHQLDRDSEAYLSVYRHRTAAERIFSQALDLGIERPKLRNQQAIANQNTLIYLLVNLRAMQRVLAKLEKTNW